MLQSTFKRNNDCIGSIEMKLIDSDSVADYAECSFLSSDEDVDTI